MDRQEQAAYLAETYADAILRLSYSYLNNTMDAQDVCQTVFVKLLSGPERRFDSPEQEKAYLLRMAANTCRDLLKSPARRRRCSLEAAEALAAPEPEDDGVLAAVSRLPEKYRAVIYLHYFEGYKAREIGAILRIPTATVHTRLARAREKLKAELGGQEYEQSL